MVRYREELQQIKELLKRNSQGMSITEIARELGKNMHSVGRYLDILQATGQVEMRQYGMAKVFSLSQRLPLAAMINFAGEGVMVLDADLRAVMVNDYFLKILGKDRDEVTGKNIHHLPIAALDIQELLEELARLPGEKTEGDFEIELDDDRFFKVKYAPTVFEDGNQGFIVILIDLTECKRAERALQESEKKYRELVENAGSIILKMDRKGNITFFNEYAQEYFGYREEEILGRNVIGTIVSPTEASGRDLTALMQEICSGSDRFRLNENENITRDGRRVWVRWSNRAIIGDDGTPTGILSIGNDITERRTIDEQLTARGEAEEALRRERDFSTAILDTVDALVLVMDTRGRIVRFNTACEKATGYASAEVLGRTVWETILPGEEAASVQSAFADLLADNGSRHARNHWITKDGAKRLIDWSNAVLRDRDGNAEYVIGTGLDITEQERAAEELQECREKVRLMQENEEA